MTLNREKLKDLKNDGFNEMTHAFIAAKYYVHLTDMFGERGKNAFIHGTQYYAQTRGRRMAQKAIRDGKELTYETYMAYGEWINTSFTIDNQLSNTSELKENNSDYIIHIDRCPWHAQFLKMNLLEAGHVYCTHLDNSICRGFNPYLTYDVEQTLYEGESCIHRVKNQYSDEVANVSKKEEYLKDWDYHCGHSYWAYNEITASIFGEEGEAVNQRVLKDFKEEYDQEMADKLVSYKFTNFNVIPY